MAVLHVYPIVRDHIPLEQGLRPGAKDTEAEAQMVRDHIPLEQGLRLQKQPAHP